MMKDIGTLRKKITGLGAAVFVASALLSGCGGIPESSLEAREAGIALLVSGEYGGAIDQFEAVIGKASKVTKFELDVLKYRAQAEASLGDFTAAAYTWDLLVQLEDKKPEYQYMEALCLAKSGDVQKSAECLEAGKAQDPDHKAIGYEEAVLALGEAYDAAGNREQAQSLYEDFLAEGQSGAGICNRLMVLSMEGGDYQEALEYGARGMTQIDSKTDSLEETLRSLKFNEAVCYEYLGQYEKALTLFEAYVQQFGGDERVEHELAFLRTR